VISAPFEVGTPERVTQVPAFKFRLFPSATLFQSTLHSVEICQYFPIFDTSFIISFPHFKSLISSPLLSLVLFNFLISEMILGVMSSFGSFLAIFS
jgi:hypothetical protein